METPQSSAEAEWNAMARAGASRRRRQLLPALVGCALFLVTTFGIILGVGAWAGQRAVQRERDLATQGLYERRVSVRSGRTIGADEQARDAGVGIFALGIAAGLAMGIGGFFASGGKLSREHGRGLGALRR